MTRPPRTRALAAGCAVAAFAAAVPSASAATMTQTLHLHGGMYTRKAMATAKVTEVSKGDYRVQITAEGLPAPAMLHVKPARHAYIAWVIDGMDRKSAMGVLPLTLDKAAGTYSVNRVVMIAHVTAIVVTADTSAMQHMPTMPEVTALTSSMKGGM